MCMTYLTTLVISYEDIKFLLTFINSDYHIFNNFWSMRKRNFYFRYSIVRFNILINFEKLVIACLLIWFEISSIF